jgi:hypothetical protein
VDGLTLDLDRIQNWGATGVNVPVLAGAYGLPAGANGDHDRRELLAEVFVALYCAVGSAQAMPRPEDAERDAVHQMVVASAAIAAGEAESYLTLASVGLEAPASIHLRSLAETVRRLVICRRDPALALRLYKTALPEWLTMMRRANVLGVPLPPMDGETLRDVERSEEFKKAKADAQAALHVLSDIEWAMGSKRTHGDIYALVDVSHKLSVRGEDVRAAINGENPAGRYVNAQIMRAIGLCLLALGNLIEEFGIQAVAVYKGLESRYGDMQERDEETGALKVRAGVP